VAVQRKQILRISIGDVDFAIVITVASIHQLQACNGGTRAPL
jgi:hypothetical protein